MRGHGLLRWLAACFLLATVGLGFVVWLGGRLVEPAPAILGAAPPDFPADTIDAGGSGIAGWWAPATDPGAASILLLHGIRADRRAMLGRARVLRDAGYSVLLIDLPAHGESAGAAITLGARESEAVAVAHRWMRRQRPGASTGAIGVSLGGAALLFDDAGPRFDAVVLEAVYGDARAALRNRIAIRTGRPIAELLAPLLEVQVKPRIGVLLDALRPVDRIASLDAPLLLLAGGRDRHTTLADSRALYALARPPRRMHVFPDAAHVDFLKADPDAWRAAVLPFLSTYLATRPAASPATASSVNGQPSSRPDTASRSTGTRRP